MTTITGTQVTTPGLNVGGVALDAAIDARVAMQALGVGQTWQNVLADRVVGTTYQNTTGRPIQINITARRSSSGAGVEISIDGTTFFNASQTGGSGNSVHSLILPAGTYYRMATGNSIDTWWELR
jgi:hypothetical protein